jgi:hypothetical protein
VGGRRVRDLWMGGRRNGCALRIGWAVSEREDKGGV